ncbi:MULTISPECIES: LytR/AlgR family response regulator transcription factor [Tenacibaculum]|nr:LytTR family DNA-binding domain-containing protein [Tenacibaculum mesophilum]KAF9659948.1 response regulator transcription factor [Tenacibaculum mesophilum]UTD16384.1 response regulator transcription factor [Tenacibaculum mesophilum]SHF54947.1 two component transcriptional regulator, LytTR family [Tenacibaculum mesophilum]
MKISILIVDEENSARLRFKNLVSDYSFIETVDESSNGLDAIKKINTLNPDVVYLDTKINDMTGFDIIEKITLPKKPIFIFTASSNEHAVKAFDYFAFDYLLKPLKEDRFYASIKKVIDYKKIEKLSDLDNIIDLVKEKTPIEMPVKGTKINIKSGNKIIFLERNAIKYISASGYYVEIFTTDNKKYLLRESLSSIIKRLNSNFFVRIHRSTIINSNFIDEIITSNYGETDVKINDNKTFRVSKSYKKDFQELMGVK